MKKFIIILLSFLFLMPQAFGSKEEIKFNLKFGFVKGGEAKLIISDTTFNGEKAVHYFLVGKTTGLTDKLFGVNDVYETTVDAQTRLPLKSIRNIEEGKYKWYNETFFYHDIDSLNSQKSGWREAPENLVDIISVFFYFINQHLFEEIEVGHTVTLPTFHADKIDDVTVKYLGEDRVDTDMGKTDCFVLAPVVDKGKLLKRSDGLKFFISKETKMPVLLEFDMKVGALRAILKSYKIDGVEQVTK
ncbi:DUF3108 domain-containing protein [Maribellus maritimus]|uniref:DUF3108 domain-containing protein n=1 Tax=Maribellus maritimus TaxID=2870838 RepID=UPI001EEBF4E6|nr:DUF3108 domain-containing protein [Maribellus maritimus]MCG6190215.1 DUF3108 domain-containing protein [Maribellus maritimus]